jgi:hypothetical protein
VVGSAAVHPCAHPNWRVPGAALRWRGTARVYAGPRAARHLGRTLTWLPATAQFGGGVFVHFSSSRTLYGSINFSVTFIAIPYALSKKGARMTNMAGIPGDRICAFIERVERIDEEIKTLNEARRTSSLRPRERASM